MAIAIAAAANPALFAHSRGLGTLDIHDQGGQVLLTWVFYYDELPPEFILPDGSGRSVSLSDQNVVKENLAKLAEVAFQLRLGDRVIHASRVAQIIALPDKTGLAIIDYPAEGGGRLEVRAPVLGLLPVNYLINVRFMDPDGKGRSTLIGRDAPPVIVSLQKNRGDAAQVSREARGPFWRGFTIELGTAWIHTDWILTAIVFLLACPPRRAIYLFGLMIVLRTVVSELVLFSGFGFPWRVPVCVLCLPVVLLTWMATKKAQRVLPIGITAAGAGILFSLCDLQASGVPERSLAGSMGYHSGFLIGLMLALGILFLMKRDLDGFLRTHGEWRGRICWAAAGISIWISVYSLVA